VLLQLVELVLVNGSKACRKNRVSKSVIGDRRAREKLCDLIELLSKQMSNGDANASRAGASSPPPHLARQGHADVGIEQRQGSQFLYSLNTCRRRPQVTLDLSKPCDGSWGGLTDRAQAVAPALAGGTTESLEHERTLAHKWNSAKAGRRQLQTAS